MEGDKRLPARTFTDLLVWQKAHALVLLIYRESQEFPRQETYGLTIQLRKAAISIPANVAEGFRKRGKPDKARFFNIAEGSTDEVRYYLILANDLGYMDSTTSLRKLDEVSRLLRAYARRIRSPTPDS